MKTPDLKGSMPAFIVSVLLLYFGLALFGAPLGVVVTSDSPMVQTLINLTLMAASFFIGTTQASSKKDETIAAQITPPVAPTPAVPPVVRVDDTAAPVKVQETPPT